MLKLKGKLTINLLLAWMDGGTITLLATDNNPQDFKNEFIQFAFLKKKRKFPSWKHGV